MLSKECVEQIKKAIRELNHLKEKSQKIDQMIEVKDKIRFQINEELDDLFAYVDLSEKRKTFEDLS